MTEGAIRQSPLVHIGLDGWLFLQGGSNFVTSLYHRDGGGLPDSGLAGWLRLLEARERRSCELGVIWRQIVVPDKLTIYGDRLAAPLVDPEQSPALRLAKRVALSRASANYVDLVGSMRNARETADVFWRTDTHWTPEGCHIAYAALCERLGVAPRRDLLEQHHEAGLAVLDLGARVDPIRWENFRRYEFARSARRTWTNYVTRCLEDPVYEEEVHVGARARYDNPQAPNPQSVLIFGDSYSKPSAEALTGMLAETFRSVEFVWSSSIDWRLVRRRRPDIVISEIAERFLAILPNDRTPIWRVEIEQTARAHRKAYKNWRVAARTKSKRGQTENSTPNVHAASGCPLTLLSRARDAPRVVRKRIENARTERRRRRLAFDPAFYRKHYPDLGGFSNLGLRRHFLQFGVAEGRLGSPYADRTAFLNLLGDGPVLEIGPFTNPSATGANVRYFDVLDAAGLMARAQDVGYCVLVEPRIDYVSPDGDLSIVNDRFAAVVSSHCIEHQADLIAHLRQVEDLLEDGGRYFLIVPDRRYCFDHFLSDSTCDEIVQAHRERRRRHPLDKVIAFRALTTHNDAGRHWRGDHWDPGYAESRETRTASAVAEFETANGAYVDVHSWQFTPMSLVDVIDRLRRRRLIRFEIESVFNTPLNRDEFCAILRKPGRS